MTTLSIRDRIKAIQKQVLAGAYTPASCRENLLLLTALYGSVIEEHREADHEYAVRLAAAMQVDGVSVSKARVLAATSPEYARAREAKDIEKLTLEMIRACKTYLRSLDEEMSLAR